MELDNTCSVTTSSLCLGFWEFRDKSLEFPSSYMNLMCIIHKISLPVAKDIPTAVLS